MIQLVYRWMQNLAVYMILVTAFLQALPENSYRKYVRFFCGLLLTVLLAQPVLDLMGEAGQVTELYRTAEYEQMIKEMEYAADLLEKGGECGPFKKWSWNCRGTACNGSCDDPGHQYGNSDASLQRNGGTYPAGV